MAIKSVPPVVARTFRHRLMATPLSIPPKIQISRVSSVMEMGGTRSVNRLVSRMDRQENRVNRRPTSRKLIRAGTAFSNR